MNTSIPLCPKNPSGPLRGIAIGRLSRPKETEDETEATLESSRRYVNEYLTSIYKGPLDILFLDEQISGMVTGRDTILRALELIESGEWDFVIVEDLSRVYRNPRWQYAFVQDCVDAGMRFIGIADGLDTADEDWEVMLGTAALRHGLHIPDTRRRQKRKAKYSFHRGGMVQKVKFGYRKLTREEADSGLHGPKDLRIVKLPERTPMFDEIRRQMIETRDPVSVVKWLREQRIPTGRYVRSGRWTMRLFKELVCDPILHGTRLFGRMKSRPIYKTGKSKRERNADPERECVPALAHMTQEQQEQMLAAVGWEINWNSSLPRNGHCRRNVALHNSYWPGQSATCANCGGTMYVMGKALKCQNGLFTGPQTCWNHVQVPLELTRVRVVTWMLAQIAAVPDARDALIDAAWESYEEVISRRSGPQKERDRQKADLQRQQANLAKAIGVGGELQPLLDELRTVNKRREILAEEDRHSLDESKQLPDVRRKEDVAGHLEEIVFYLCRHSYEFAAVLRKFFPEFVIQPVQALDSGQVRPRGRLRFRPTAGGNIDQQNGEPIEVVFDLFKPPEHIRLMPASVSARARTPRPTLRQIADELHTSYMTVKRGLGHAKRMEELGTTDPYRELHEAPAKVARWR